MSAGGVFEKDMWSKRCCGLSCLFPCPVESATRSEAAEEKSGGAGRREGPIREETQGYKGTCSSNAKHCVMMQIQENGPWSSRRCMNTQYSMMLLIINLKHWDSGLLSPGIFFILITVWHICSFWEKSLFLNVSLWLTQYWLKILNLLSPHTLFVWFSQRFFFNWHCLLCAYDASFLLSLLSSPLTPPMCLALFAIHLPPHLWLTRATHPFSALSSSLSLTLFMCVTSRSWPSCPASSWLWSTHSWRSSTGRSAGAAHRCLLFLLPLVASRSSMFLSTSV